MSNAIPRSTTDAGRLAEPDPEQLLRRLEGQNSGTGPSPGRQRPWLVPAKCCPSRCFGFRRPLLVADRCRHRHHVHCDRYCRLCRRDRCHHHHHPGRYCHHPHPDRRCRLHRSRCLPPLPSHHRSHCAVASAPASAVAASTAITILGDCEPRVSQFHQPKAQAEQSRRRSRRRLMRTSKAPKHNTRS